MKRWRLWIGVALATLAALVAAVTVAAWLFVDPAALRTRLLARAGAALGRSVELGPLELSLFPRPGLVGKSLVIGGDAGGPALARIDQVRVGLSPWPLLFGRIVLTRLEIERPHIQLEVDDQGLPVLPSFGPAEPEALTGVEPEAERESGRAAPAPEERGARFAVQRITISNGMLRAGAWAVDDLGLRGRIALDGRVELRMDALLPELGAISDARLVIDPAERNARRIDARADLEAIDLAVLAKRLPQRFEFVDSLQGRLDGSVAAELRASDLRSFDAQLELKALDVRSGPAELRGRVPVRAMLGGPFSLDLTGTEIVVGERIRKPEGGRLLLAGDLGRTLSPALGLDARLQIANSSLPLRIRIPTGPAAAGKDSTLPPVGVAATPALEIETGTLEIGPLAQWFQGGSQDISGQIQFSNLRANLAPLELAGKIDLEGVDLGLDGGRVELAGPINARGTRLVADPVTVTVAEQRSEVRGSYDLADSMLDMTLSATDAQLEPILTAFTGKADLLGALTAKAALKGTPGLETLRGEGEMDIRDGRIRGFSLLQQAFGWLAELASQVATARGKDLSRFEEEGFERLHGVFSLRDGRLEVRSLDLDYRYAKASLRGQIGLEDQALDLEGSLALAPAVTSEIVGEATEEKLEIPIDHIRGTLQEPRVEFDRSEMLRTLAAVGVRARAGGELGERMEKKLGKEGAEAVRDLLEGILGGRKKK